jgi:hypothetical protein
MDPDSRLPEQVVLPTLSELLFKTRGREHSRRELESIVAEIAATYGASHDQLGAMVKHLPPFLIALRSANQNTHQSTMSSSPVIANGWCLDTHAAMAEEFVYSLSINGRRRKATEFEVRSINPKDFAVYLDVTTKILASRLHGEKSRIETTETAGVSGVEDILGVLLENPHLNFGNVNIGVFLPHRAGMTPDAFRKAMARIRNALQGVDENGPVLLRMNRSHFSISDSGFAWRMSMGAGDLCFIRFLLQPERFRRKRRQ